MSVRDVIGMDPWDTDDPRTRLIAPWFDEPNWIGPGRGPNTRDSAGYREDGTGRIPTVKIDGQRRVRNEDGTLEWEIYTYELPATEAEVPILGQVIAQVVSGISGISSNPIHAGGPLSGGVIFPVPENATLQDWIREATDYLEVSLPGPPLGSATFEGLIEEVATIASQIATGQTPPSEGIGQIAEVFVGAVGDKITGSIDTAKEAISSILATGGDIAGWILGNEDVEVPDWTEIAIPLDEGQAGNSPVIAEEGTLQAGGYENQIIPTEPPLNNGGYENLIVGSDPGQTVILGDGSRPWDNYTGPNWGDLTDEEMLNSGGYSNVLPSSDIPNYLDETGLEGLSLGSTPQGTAPDYPDASAFARDERIAAVNEIYENNFGRPVGQAGIDWWVDGDGGNVPLSELGNAIVSGAQGQDYDYLNPNVNIPTGPVDGPLVNAPTQKGPINEFTNEISEGVGVAPPEVGDGTVTNPFLDDEYREEVFEEFRNDNPDLFNNDGSINEDNYQDYVLNDRVWVDDTYKDVVVPGGTESRLVTEGYWEEIPGEEYTYHIPDEYGTRRIEGTPVEKTRLVPQDPIQVYHDPIFEEQEVQGPDQEVWFDPVYETRTTPGSLSYNTVGIPTPGVELEGKAWRPDTTFGINRPDYGEYEMRPDYDFRAQPGQPIQVGYGPEGGWYERDQDPGGLTPSIDIPGYPQDGSQRESMYRERFPFASNAELEQLHRLKSGEKIDPYGPDWPLSWGGGTPGGWIDHSTTTGDTMRYETQQVWTPPTEEEVLVSEGYYETIPGEVTTELVEVEPGWWETVEQDPIEETYWDTPEVGWGGGPKMETYLVTPGYDVTETGDPTQVWHDAVYEDYQLPDTTESVIDVPGHWQNTDSFTVNAPTGMNVADLQDEWWRGGYDSAAEFEEYLKGVTVGWTH